jgi:glycyl-tRNA synthetase beta chain
MPELLLELLSEEIPARMQARAADDLKRLVTDGLTKAGLSYDRAEAYATPRRLALVIDGVPTMKPEEIEEKRGPRTTAPENAVQGFVSATAMVVAATVEPDELFKQLGDAGDSKFWFEISGDNGTAKVSARSTEKGDYLYAEISRSPSPTTDILPEVLQNGILSVEWPNSMRWGAEAVDGEHYSPSITWVRPLQNLLVVFAGKPLSGGFSLGRTDRDFRSVRWYRPEEAPPTDVSLLVSTNRTRGHRFLSPKEFAVRNFSEYRTKLRDKYVLLDARERKAKIKKGAEALARKAGLTLRDDRALLDEVTGLVEWPVVLIGDIDPEFMEVPPEVLVTAMRTHQKYFALEDETGALAPKFIVVANIETKDKGKAIVAGNERVLRARLSDAKFFWDQDRRISLAARAPALEQIVFHARLGTLDQKVDRIEALAAALAPLVGADRDHARSAARLAKADLTTGMVGEFPELQGVMGRYYALHDGESADVADAIAEHYAPQGPNDRCPTAPVSVAVALADKMDTLAGFWAIGEKPTGSRDPYGLRRAALGIIRLVIENELRLALIPLLNEAAHMVINQQLLDSVMERRAAMDELGLDEQLAVETMEVEVEEHADYGEVYAIVFELLAFFADRLKVHLRERGVRHDHIDAVFALGGEDDILRLLARVHALGEFLRTEDGENLLAAYRRANNIVRIEEKKDGVSHDGAAEARRFEQPEEKALYKALESVSHTAAKAVATEDFAGAMTALAGLRGPIDAFFEAVTVNAEDASLRANRLRLLSHIRTTMDRVADFSNIGGQTG